MIEDDMIERIKILDPQPGEVVHIQAPKRAGLDSCALAQVMRAVATIFPRVTVLVTEHNVSIATLTEDDLRRVGLTRLQ